MRHSTAPALLVLLLAAAPAGGQDTRFTPPPGPDTPEVQAEIAKLARRLETKAVEVSGVLSDPAYLPLHPVPAFRALIKQHAPTGRVRMVAPGEPGDPMTVTATVLRADGKPAAGALVYVYQTSAKGWYAGDAAHVSGNSGDQRHARLFAYVKTDAQGRFEATTIRPAGYPGTNLPAHIHVEISSQEGQRRVTEIQFDDDPRLTPEWRARSRGDGFVIVPVERQGGVQRVSMEFRLR